MGIPGILKEIGKGERVALSKLAIEHLEKTNRPLRIAIDAAIWNFQTAASQGGKNPALRTLFFKLLKILALPIHPVFVYDGTNKPLTKRGKTVSRYGTRIENEMAKHLLAHFKFPYHTAPGEAEAECAILQTNGIVDAVMSQDVDAIMFGSKMTLRDWSKEGTRGNKTPTHVNVLDSLSIQRMSGIDSAGMIIVALLSGGDYDEGVAGFGSGLACEIAKAGFGTDLLDAVKSQNSKDLQEWKQRLEYELQTNESGHFKRKHPKLSLPEQFPDSKVLGYYMTPAVSRPEILLKLEEQWVEQWRSNIDICALRQYTATTFDWNWKSGARRFVRCIAQPLFQQRLSRGLVQHSIYNADSILDDRKHFTNDGISELRFTAVPADVVGIDIEAEPDNPEFSSQAEEEVDEEELPNGDDVEAKELPVSLTISHKKRVPWSPYSTEKWWIPSTLLKLSLASVVEEWEQRQRDMLADPKKFATRKCPKVQKKIPPVDKTMKSGAMLGFLEPSHESIQHTTRRRDKVVNRVSRNSPRKEYKPQQQILSEESVRSITQFFKPQKSFVGTSSKSSFSTAKEDISSAFRTPPIYPTATLHESTAAIMLGGGKQMLASLEHSDTRPRDDVYERQAEILVQEEDFVQESSFERRTRQSKCAKSSGQQAMTYTLKSESVADPMIDSQVVEIRDDSQRELEGGTTGKKLVSKFSAVPRESLPGAWKESGNDFGSKKDNRRVSYIDLTED